jgi:acetyl esterase/lipase
VREITYPSSIDNSQQRSMFYNPGGRRMPLLIALHTWSAGYEQPNYGYAEWCIANGWVFMHPDFRGFNNKPEATGSELVVADIVSAVEYARNAADIDPERIYLMGCSGGGYAALLLAGRHPEIWAGVSSWVPIFDLATWHRDSSIRRNGYAEHLELSCGGAPGSSPAADAEYRKRSACTYLANAKNVLLDINTGITDGHTGSVPVSHALNAYNLLAASADRVADADIEYMVEKAAIPPALQDPALKDPLYGEMPPLFRKVSGNVRITVFDGGHSSVLPAGLGWLNEQRLGAPVKWQVTGSNAPLNAKGSEVAG